MRLKCEFKTEKIPVAYQFMFVSLIKEALKISNEDYYQKLYFYDGDKKNKKSKNFCFSVYISGFKKEDNIFKVEDKVILYISSPDYEFAFNLYNGLLKMGNFSYKKEYKLTKKNITLIKEKSINSKEVIFNALSPICIKDIDNKPLDINEIEFLKELNYITDKILKNYRGYGLNKKLQFIPLKMKKRVVKEYIKNFENNTGKKDYYINGYMGIFKLIGDIEDLKDIYNLGLGFKRSQGFGMIEVLS